MTLRVTLGSLLLSALVACGAQEAPAHEAGTESELEVDEPALGELGGLGQLTARAGSGETALVELESLRVSALQQGDLAEVEVEQTFRSDADVVLEGTFRFPLPEHAIMTGLSLWIDGVEQHGELVEHDKARRVFEQIVDAMQDPALLEWEHGRTFKMRVFPIAPHEHKRLKVRYLAPLLQARRGLEFVHKVSPPPGGKLQHVSVQWRGKTIFDQADVAREQLLRADAASVAPVSSEQTGDATYLIARIKPDWSRIPIEQRSARKHWLIVADTSRSALEERGLVLQSVRSSIAALPLGSQFVVATSDLQLQVDPRGFRPATAQNLEAALQFVESVSSDGATDLEAMLVGASSLLKSLPDAAVLYVGDCEATWGETRADKLAQRAAELLGEAPLHIVLLGDHSSEATALVDRTNGRLLRARTGAQVQRFAKALSLPLKQLRQLALSSTGGAQLVDEGRQTLSFGETLTVGLKLPLGQALPRTLHVEGVSADHQVAFDVPLKPMPAPGVAKRFGALWVSSLERSEQAKQEIVAASLAYQVMSKHTSFLVLESEEAYARFQIERHAAAANEAPRISGGDLESASADGASINLDRIQPGDPEIYVHAPADARSVEVSFPFGVTKHAHFDREADAGRGAWMVRFLVPLETAEGTYDALVRVQHRDGRLEQLTVHYTVDRTAPELVVEAQRLPHKLDRVRVRVSARGAANTIDLRRVEVRTPDGRILELRAVLWGQFEGQLRIARGTLGKLRVVGMDQALNHAALEVELP